MDSGLGPPRAESSFTLSALQAELKRIRARGWIRTQRPGNDGGIGNTLEDLLGIRENNIPTADAGPFEIKAHGRQSTSLVTLLHMEPWPRDQGSIVPGLVSQYGWPHETLQGEKSFRQTIRGDRNTDRGFCVALDRSLSRVILKFECSRVDSRHGEWLRSVELRAGLGDLSPTPQWPFDKLRKVISGKIGNLIYVVADIKREDGVYFCYNEAWVLRDFEFDKFLEALEQGDIYVDFDARTSHNHGTKFRLRSASWPKLYESKERLY